MLLFNAEVLCKIDLRCWLRRGRVADAEHSGNSQL